MLQVLLHTKGMYVHVYNHVFNHGQITLQMIIVCNVNISFLKKFILLFFSLLVASSGSFSPSIMVDLNETDMLVGVTFSINVSQYSLELCFFMILIWS